MKFMSFGLSLERIVRVQGLRSRAKSQLRIDFDSGM